MNALSKLTALTLRRSSTAPEKELPIIGSYQVVAVVLALGGAAWIYSATGGRYIGTVVGLGAAYLVAGLGYNLVLGYSGQMAFGHAGFMAISAFTYAVLQERGVASPLAFACGVGLAGLAAIPVAVAVLRTRHVYLALVTLAFAEAVWLLAERIPATHGDNGIAVDLNGSDAVYLTIASAVIAILSVHRLTRSRVGRALVMVRSDEDAATALGVPVVSTRILAFVLSGFLGGVGGVLLAGVLQYVTPSNFGVNLTLLLLTMIIVGGLGSVWGTVIGVAFIVLVNQLLGLVVGFQNFGYGVILFLFLALLPGGLASMPRVVRAWSQRSRSNALPENPIKAFVYQLSSRIRQK